MSLKGLAKIFGILTIIAILCFALLAAEQFVFSTMRAKNNFRIDKKALLKNWDKNEKAIIALNDFVNENPIVLKFLEIEQEHYSVKVGKNHTDIDNFNIIDLFLFNEYRDEHSDYYIRYNDSIIENIDTSSFLIYGREDDILKRFENKSILSNMQIDSLKKLCQKANVQGFWRDEANALLIQYSGNNFLGSFNYKFLGNEAINDKVETSNMLNDSICFHFEVSGLYCGKPIYIEN